MMDAQTQELLTRVQQALVKITNTAHRNLKPGDKLDRIGQTARGAWALQEFRDTSKPNQP